MIYKLKGLGPWRCETEEGVTVPFVSPKDWAVAQARLCFSFQIGPGGEAAAHPLDSF
jgi:hypothetical protein